MDTTAPLQIHSAKGMLVVTTTHVIKQGSDPVQLPRTAVAGVTFTRRPDGNVVRVHTPTDDRFLLYRVPDGDVLRLIEALGYIPALPSTAGKSRPARADDAGKPSPPRRSRQRAHNDRRSSPRAHATPDERLEAQAPNSNTSVHPARVSLEPMSSAPALAADVAEPNGDMVVTVAASNGSTRKQQRARKPREEAQSSATRQLRGTTANGSGAKAGEGHADAPHTGRRQRSGRASRRQRSGRASRRRRLESVAAPAASRSSTRERAAAPAQRTSGFAASGPARRKATTRQPLASTTPAESAPIMVDEQVRTAPAVTEATEQPVLRVHTETQDAGLALTDSVSTTTVPIIAAGERLIPVLTSPRETEDVVASGDGAVGRHWLRARDLLALVVGVALLLWMAAAWVTAVNGF